MAEPATQKKQPEHHRTTGYTFILMIFTAVLAAVAGCSTDVLQRVSVPEVVGEPTRSGSLANPDLKEVSGLAASRQFPGLFWAINDGGGGPLLYAVGNDGSDLGVFRVEGAQNFDWEALASFRRQDNAYLLIADVGDNWQQRQTVTLYVVKEPAITAAGLDSERVAEIAWQVRFTYEDGPSDCEAVAVDPIDQRVLLLAKRSVPPVLYELPLQPADPNTPAVARRLATVPHFKWPTGMDLSPDGLSAVLLTYNKGYLFKRRPQEDWPAAFQRKPQRLRFDTLVQQEAICFGYYGKSVWVTSERRPAPLIRINLDE